MGDKKVVMIKIMRTVTIMMMILVSVTGYDINDDNTITEPILIRGDIICPMPLRDRCSKKDHEQ